jgi:hypothetical protein
MSHPKKEVEKRVRMGELNFGIEGNCEKNSKKEKMKTNLPIQSHPSADAACEVCKSDGRTKQTTNGNQQKARKFLLVLIHREKRGDDLFSRSSLLLLLCLVLDIVTGCDISSTNPKSLSFRLKQTSVSFFSNVLLTHTHALTHSKIYPSGSKVTDAHIVDLRK